MRAAIRFVASVAVLNLGTASCEASGPELFLDSAVSLPSAVASSGPVCWTAVPAVSTSTVVGLSAVAEQDAGAQPGGNGIDAAGGGEREVATRQPIGDSACPSDMNLVEGGYCPDVQQDCANWIDDPVRFPYARCAEFVKPTICKAQRVPLRFCIDRLEASEDSGMPIGNISWTDASHACQAHGKRLCQEREWVFACEGEESRPYPYGYVRSPQLCNFERTEGLVTSKGELADHRQMVTANTQCVSPFGVQNMVGNIDEWVVLDRPHYSAKNNGRRMMSGLKGGWWGPLRNRCRPTTVDHDEVFRELQTGYRCCAAAKGETK